MSGIFDEGLERNAANYAPLTPVSFVERSAEIFGDLTSVIHGAPPLRLDGDPRPLGAARGGARRRSASAAARPSASCSSNTPEMLEAHYAIPALGAVINAHQHPPRCPAARLADEPLRDDRC